MLHGFKNLFRKFRDVTLDVINALKKEEYELGNNLLDKRREVIGEIEQIEYTIEEFRALDEEFKLLDLKQRTRRNCRKEKNKNKKTTRRNKYKKKC